MFFFVRRCGPSPRPVTRSCPANHLVAPAAARRRPPHARSHEQKQLTQDLTMHPSYFNQALRGHLGNELRRQVEGTCSGRLGYIVAVVLEEVDASGSHRGRIMEDGQAVFSIKYRAVVYRPFRNEVVDGVVSSVNKVRGGRGRPVSILWELKRRSHADGHLCRRRPITVLHLDPCAFRSSRVFLHCADARPPARSLCRQTLALIPTLIRPASRARKIR